MTMQRLLPVTGLALVGLLLFPTTAMAVPAEEPPPETVDAQVEQFSVIGDMEIEVGEEVTVEALESVGIEEDTAIELLGEEEPDEESAPAFFIQNDSTAFVLANAKVGWSWKDNTNRAVVLRTDVNHKIVTKHNVNWKVARTTTKYPKSVNNVGTRAEYRTPVQDVRCTGSGVFRKCKSVGSTTVLTVADHRKLGFDNKKKGVVTTYCPNVKNSQKCPNYVKNAVNQ